MLIAFIVALAATMPVGARGMPMSADAMGMAIHNGCQTCPHDQTGSNPGKMPACQVLACASVIAVLPVPALLPVRILLYATYLTALPVRWTAAPPAPDPFPPRPVVLI
ncbi:MAG: hypothetical protein M3Y41_22410 [Pseudomonadota bacterium]|nr:hypothetical protein [Pseudomonadota bacterium]